MEHPCQSQKYERDLLNWELDMIQDMSHPRITPERWITGCDLLYYAVGFADMVLKQEEHYGDIQHGLRFMRRTLWEGLPWMAGSRQQVGDRNALAREVAHALWASHLMRQRLWRVTNARDQARYEPVVYRYTAWETAGQMVARALRDH